MSLRKIQPKSDRLMMDGPAEKMADKKVYPRFRIELEHLPEAKKWDIGKEYTVTMKLKMTGISISRFQNDSEFDILAIDPGTKGSKMKKVEKEEESEEEYED